MDWNNDGRHDLLIGNATGNIHVFLNYGSNEDPVLRKDIPIMDGNAIMNAGARTAPEIADWNGDGKKDILVGSMDGKIKIYLNKGSDASPVFRGFYYLQVGGKDFTLHSRSAPRVYDWNGDGLEDILAGEMFGHVYFLKNTGSNQRPVFERAEKLFLSSGDLLRYRGAGKAPRSRVYVSDWNKDDHKDILLGGYDGRVMLFLASPVPISSIHSFINRHMNQSRERFSRLYTYSRKKAGSIKRGIKSVLN